jgi:dethiobiotin synthetase
MARVIFVTGTDTSVGKTALTALLLAQAQAEGINVRALKPISTGDGGDESLLSSLQKSSLRINFFNFPEPVAPRTAARIHGETIQLEAVLAPILEHRSSCELLLIEGAGGLLTPLGESFTAADLISELNAEVIVVAANRLGVLNHTLLTVEALRNRSVTVTGVALVDVAGTDISRKWNLQDLTELLAPMRVVAIPFIENFRPDAEFIRASAKRLRGELELLLDRTGKKNPPDTEAEGTFP